MPRKKPATAKPATNPDHEARKARISEQRLALREKQLAISGLLMEQAHQRAKKLTESYDSWGWLGGYEDVLDRIRQPGKELYAPMSTVNDRRHGNNWPFWRTWAEHARLRASARLLAQLSPMASGALQGLSAYVVGTGYTYRATTTQSAPEALVAAVQDVIDEFVRENNWPAVEQEGFIRSRRDGELFHLHEPDNGRLYVCVVEPEQVQQPPGEVDEEYSYGIETRGRRTDKPLRYNVIEDADPNTAEEYDPGELFHLKINVDRKVKRGLTDLCYDTHDALRTAGRLVDHIGSGAAIQASIALIRQHDTADPSAVQDFVTAASDYDRYDPIAGQTEHSERFQPGKILDIDKGQNYIAPPFAANVSGYLEVVQGVLRSVAVKWNAPEWIVSADASNNNYSSSITAESPFVKRCYQEQERYKEFYRRSVLLAIKVAAAAGRIRAHGRVWTAAEVAHLIEVQVEAPNIEVRDDYKTAQTDSVYITNGVKSVQTTRQQLGLDDAQEDANILHSKKLGAGKGDQQQGQQQGDPDDPTAALRGSVGGSQALMAMQTAYYAKQLPREAVMATARVVYGFSEEDAALLFPEIAPDAPEAEPEPGADMGGGGGGDLPPDAPPDSGGDEFADDQGDENPLDDLLGGGVESLREEERTDKRGHHYCIDDTTGHRIPCAEKAAQVKARHKAGVEQIKAKREQAREILKGDHAAKKAEMSAALKAKIAQEKEQGRAELKKIGKRQKALRTNVAALRARLKIAEGAADDARKVVDDALAAKDYLSEQLDDQLGRFDYTAEELLATCRTLLGDHFWNPAEDDDWSQTDYDEATDSEQPIHSEEETAAEAKRRAEARDRLKALIAKLVPHAQTESRIEPLEAKIEAAESELDDAEEARQAVVDAVNEKIAAHREAHNEEYHNNLRAKSAEAREVVKGKVRAALDAHRERTEAALAAVRDEHEAGRDAAAEARQERIDSATGALDDARADNPILADHTAASHQYDSHREMLDDLKAFLDNPEAEPGKDPSTEYDDSEEGRASFEEDHQHWQAARKTAAAIIASVRKAARKGGTESARLTEYEKKDIRGHRNCYDDQTGKRAKCAPKEKPAPKKKEPKVQPAATAKKPRTPAKPKPDKTTSPEKVQAAHKALTDALASGDPAQVVDALAGHNHATLKALAKALGAKMHGGALAIAKRLAAEMAKPAEKVEEKPAEVKPEKKPRKKAAPKEKPAPQPEPEPDEPHEINLDDYAPGGAQYDEPPADTRDGVIYQKMAKHRERQANQATPQQVERAERHLLGKLAESPDSRHLHELRGEMPTDLRGHAFDAAVMRLAEKGHANVSRDGEETQAHEDDVWNDRGRVLSFIGPTDDMPAPQKTPEVKRAADGSVDWDSFSFDPED